MKVEITKALKALLDAQGPDDADELIDGFIEWKSGDEYGHYLFGKDGGYRTPAVGLQQYALRHVHLVPITDQLALKSWDKAYDRGVHNGKGAKKTSNRVLVYVANGKNTEFLLIYVLPEPDAHKIADMKTTQDSLQMKRFAKIAEAYLDSGEIIA